MTTHLRTRLPRRTVALATALLVCSIAGASAIGAHAPEPPTGGHRDPALELTGPQRTVIRQATQRFRDIDTALAAGYLPTDECVELPGTGGMGYHYVHPELMETPGIDPTLPEVLVYAPTRRGRDLVAVEYLTVDDDQDLSTDADRPTLFGHGFDGPMPGHEPGMPIHYDLHAWAYLDNPSGELAPWNPRVTCPAH